MQNDSPYNSIHNSINLNHQSKVGFLVLFSNFTIAGICIRINEAVLVFHLQGIEVFISFIFSLEGIINFWQSFIPKKCQQYLSKSYDQNCMKIKIAWIFLFFIKVVFHSIMLYLACKCEEVRGSWVSLPLHSFWKTGIIGSLLNYKRMSIKQL